MGQGVHLRGEVKGVNPVTVGKPIVRSVVRRQGRDLKGSAITRVILETE